MSHLMYICPLPVSIYQIVSETIHYIILGKRKQFSSRLVDLKDSRIRDEQKNINIFINKS